MAEKTNSGWGKWILIGVVLAAGAAGFYYFRQSQAVVVEFKTEAVTRGGLTKLVTATGTLNPVVNVTVGSQVSGRISKLNVDFNSPVTKGEVLAEIDPSTYQATVESVTADLANSRANLELQQAQYDRSSELFTNKLISGSDYDIARATLSQAQATVKIKQASLNNAMVNLNYCKIVAPVDGVVISRAVELGQTVASSFNTPTIFQIANDLTKMQIDSAVAEADVGGVLEGQEVSFLVDAYSERTFHGSVIQVRNSPTTVNNVVTYDCVIGVTNADYKLKPGMTANVSIVVAQRDNVLIIPNSALRFRPPEDAVVVTNAATATNGGRNFAAGSGGPAGGRGRGGGGPGGGRGRGDRPAFHTVYVQTGVGKDVKLQATQVRTGITDGIDTEVVSGLDEGAQVVTGIVSTSPVITTSPNPLGGGFPRR
jgi:HlyD family secretion protein